MFRFRMTALAVAAAALVAGCGGSTTKTSSTTGSTTTTAPATKSIATPTDGKTFTDPDGAFTLAVAPDWTQSPDGSKAWFLTQGDDTFRDNVNVLVEALPAGLDLDGYTQASLKNAPKLIEDLVIKGKDRVTLASGEPAMRLRFSGTASGRNMEFLQIYAVATGKRAVVVTLTAPAARIDGDVTVAEPYMRTVVANP